MRMPKPFYTGRKLLLLWSMATLKKARMNECKTHSNWAMQILMLAEAFGVVDSESSAL